jgi:anaerobic ribonucleoside-triphosphate reductase activating protein
MTTNDLQLAAYLPRSRANGPGLRSVIWVQGCPFHCPGCFNPDFTPFTGGRNVPTFEIIDWILSEEDTEGVSFSGGEPFCQATALAEVAERIRDAGKGVLIFTGFTVKALNKNTHANVQRLLSASDLLVAGPYQREEPSRHPLLASTNQELIFLTERYRQSDLGPRRMEFRIGATGEVTMTGFPLSNRKTQPNLVTQNV